MSNPQDYRSEVWDLEDFVIKDRDKEERDRISRAVLKSVRDIAYRLYRDATIRAAFGIYPEEPIAGALRKSFSRDAAMKREKTLTAFQDLQNDEEAIVKRLEDFIPEKSWYLAYQAYGGDSSNSVYKEAVIAGKEARRKQAALWFAPVRRNKGLS